MTGWQVVRVRVPLLAAVALACVAVLWAVHEHIRAAKIAEELDHARLTNRELSDSLRTCTRRVRDLDRRISYWSQQTSSARQNQGMLLNEYDIGWLRQQGLEDPVDDLRRDLMAHPELIPSNATLGATMRFEEDSIAILSTRWVYASFADGHSGARCLLSYHVEPGGRIAWKYMAEMPYVE